MKRKFKKEFLQYQQNEQLPLIVTHRTQKTRPLTTYDVVNPSPGLGYAQKCDEVKLVNGIPTFIIR